MSSDFLADDADAKTTLPLSSGLLDANGEAGASSSLVLSFSSLRIPFGL